MATDFYMTLPSNASMKTHLDNTLTHYTTDLPRRIDLIGEWECGLTEMQYSHTWYNVTEDDVWLFLNEIDVPDDVTRRAKLSCGYFDDPLTLMYHVNNGLYSLRTAKTRAQMSYSSVTQKMTLHMTENTLFTIPYHSSIASMLGFHESVATRADTTTTTTSASSPVSDSRTSDSSYPFHIEAPDVVDMTQGFNTLYVYTDVVESRVVGDTLGDLANTYTYTYSYTHTPLPLTYGLSDELRLLRPPGRRCAARLRRCVIPARSWTGQSVRRSVAQRHGRRGFG